MSKAALKAPGLLAAAAMLAACQTTQEAEAGRPGSDPVSLDEALVLTDSICGATRPDFAGAKARMVAEGLTVEKDGRNYSPTKNVSASVAQISDGRVVCSVRSTFQGNRVALDRAMAERFGPRKTRDQISPFIEVYNLGPKGKLLLLTQPARAARSYTIYDLGYAQGI